MSCSDVAGGFFAASPVGNGGSGGSVDAIVTVVRARGAAAGSNARWCVKQVTLVASRHPASAVVRAIV